MDETFDAHGARRTGTGSTDHRFRSERLLLDDAGGKGSL